jgi:hypothetical protein
MSTDIIIHKGSTFAKVVRWEKLPFIFTPITAISKAAPAVITAPGHGLVTGQRAFVTGAGGMRRINAHKMPPYKSDFHRIIAVDPSNVQFNDVDSTNYTAYTSGGSLVTYTPESLAAATARMQIRETVESPDPALVSLVSPTDIVIDDAAHTITITISDTATTALTFATGVYDLEVVVSGVVTQLLSGNVVVLPEVTR